MTNTNTKTALITGANSGIGFALAARLAKDGWGKIILACRSIEKGKSARKDLMLQTGNDPFEVLAMDTSEAESAKQAAEDLKSLNTKIDFLVLNAGASSKDPKFNSNEVEITYASTLVGHHVFTMEALRLGLLSEKARIVIAGSEGARGSVPGMTVHDIPALAEENHNGQLVDAIKSLMHIKEKSQIPFRNMNEYVTAKLMVVWWTAALAKQLPSGITVNTVSPGSVLSTSFIRDGSFGMKYLMVPFMKLIGPFTGMSHSIDNAIQRFIDAYEFDDQANGYFFATANRKKLGGPMNKQMWPEYFFDNAGQEATFKAMENLTGTPYPN